MSSANNSSFQKITGLMRLYRIDSFCITVLSFFVTVFIVNGPVFQASTIVLGFSLGMVFVNFIYSLNSYFDADIDAINKPYRPIPSGMISKYFAFRYIVALGILSIALPAYFAYNKQVFFALYSFPVIGILYSNPVFPFKKKAALATLLTSLLLVLPATLALLVSHSFEQYWYFALVVFLYCCCLVPLKDIEDVEGDVAHNSGNWAHIAGEKQLLVYSITGLVVLDSFLFLFRQQPGLIYLFGVFLAIIAVEIYFLLLGKSLKNVYKTIILSNIILLVTGFIGFLIKTKFL